jgi:DNA-directed RNA polymerase specialized sigma24 family protein
MEQKEFEQLFRLYSPRLKKYAANLLHDEVVADDLVQDIFFSYGKTAGNPPQWEIRVPICLPCYGISVLIC